MEERNAARRPARASVASAVVCGQNSRTWRRQLGALAWAILEELALTARLDDRGWASPADVHTLARGIGTTAASALGGLAALIRASLVTLEPCGETDGHRHSVYRLLLPDGVAVCDRSDDQDPARGVPRRCPNNPTAGPSTRADHRGDSYGDRRHPADQDGIADDGASSRRHQSRGHCPKEQP